MLENYKQRFRRGTKHIFVPNEECVRKGEIILAHVEANFSFPDFFYHYKSGGHVAAIHEHLKNRLFFRIDLQNFFYSIARNRVIGALRAIGVPKARMHGKWSCVKNPYGAPTYSLPIGFIQSPALASICLTRSPLFAAIERARASGVFCSVYFDDFVCSADCPARLETAFDDFVARCGEAGFPINPHKVIEPANKITAFNCTVREGFAEVTEERIAEFFAKPHTAVSVSGFERYRALVERNNAAPRGL